MIISVFFYSSVSTIMFIIFFYFSSFPTLLLGPSLFIPLLVFSSMAVARQDIVVWWAPLKGPRGTELMLSLLSLSLALPCYHCCNSSLFVYHCLLRQHPNSPLSPSPHLRSHHMSLWDWQPPLRVRAGTDGIWMVHSCMKKVSGWRKWSEGTLNCELSMTKSHCNNYHFPVPDCVHTLLHTQTQHTEKGNHTER